jgi:hypothetical protein
VLATAHGNIIYPLLNLFHRQITVDFGWDLKNVFLDFYDKIFLLNFFFIVVLFVGIFFFKKYLKAKQKKIFLAFLIAFIITLYLFTVNIGPLKDLFLIFGKIPGFVMFRNFFDKFALAYVFFYAVILSYSIEIVKKVNNKFFNITITIFIALVFLNFSQIGPIINAPLWQTTDVGRNIVIPKEYLFFMQDVKSKISSTNNILSVPFGTALYSVIKDENSNNVYTGTSPVKLFSGVNDLSGFLSFYFSDAKGIIEYQIINRDYKNLKDLLKTYNVNYLFVNNNIPQNVLNSWVFDRRMNKAQDKEFMGNLAESNALIESSEGNYKLYRVKEYNKLLSSKNMIFQKLNETKFNLHFTNLKEKQILIFYDSFQTNWRLYPNKFSSIGQCKKIDSKECKEKGVFLEGDELKFMFKKSVFTSSHKVHSKYFVNSWIVDPTEIKSNFDKSFYRINKDGSMDLDLTLYFFPQVYFYLGTILSLTVLLANVLYLLNYYLKHKNE